MMVFHPVMSQNPARRLTEYFLFVATPIARRPIVLKPTAEPLAGGLLKNDRNDYFGGKSGRPRARMRPGVCRSTDFQRLNKESGSPCAAALCRPCADPFA
jgi:hypothetical protein